MADDDVAEAGPIEVDKMISHMKMIGQASLAVAGGTEGRLCGVINTTSFDETGDGVVFYAYEFLSTLGKQEEGSGLNPLDWPNPKHDLLWAFLSL